MMKNFAIVGIIIGLLFAALGLATSSPSDVIRTGILARDNRDVGGYVRYVGGDAYNFIIEASIRGGEIAGRNAARATYLTGGFIMVTGSLITLGVALDKEKKEHHLQAPVLTGDTAQGDPPDTKTEDTPTETENPAL